jgi:LacI family transcriptional regulator
MASDPAALHPRRVSLRDVALKVGVSHVTVSLALRGDTRISASRRTEVEAAARKLGYRPDPMLSSLASYRMSKRQVGVRATIAWINQWPDPRELRRHKEFDAYWRGARDCATRLGYRLQSFEVEPEMHAPRLEQILAAQNIHGILLPPHSAGLSLPGFDWGNFSIVRLGTSVKVPRAHIVTSDQSNCASMVFARMWERGYRRIGYIASHRHDLNTGGNFRAGYLSAQNEHVPLRRHLDPLHLSEDDPAADLRRLKTWLKQVRPDGVIASSPNLADLLERAGCQVPRDLGVAATSLLDGHFSAGVDQNSLEIGRVAMTTLAALIHQNERGIPHYCRRILVEGRWVDGSSLPARHAHIR